MSSDHSVKVAVRIRPLVESEKDRGCQSIVNKTPTEPQIVVNCDAKKPKIFRFNYVFAPEDTQEMIYENAVKSMVLKLFSGYNVTILAYGQTGSGKTHTMGTTFDGNRSDEMGVIPRAIDDICEMIASMPDHEFTVECSFVELYQEKLYDLLSQSSREQSIVDIRENDGKIVIQNLTERLVKTTMETTSCLMEGSSKRAVGATAMNAQSSRSHAIFTITVQKTPKADPASATIAKFHLVDLAGSERSKKTQTAGEQFNEGKKINLGLLELGKVISALGSEKQNNGHINYRNSKLTRLLQDSLGGNSMTLMIACVSPADYNCEETVGTLSYADNAKKIKNKPIINEDPKTAEINRLKAEIQSLRVEMLSKSNDGSAAIGKCQKCEALPTKVQLQREVRDLTEKMQIALFEMAHRENVLTEYEETIETLNGKIDGLKQQIIELGKINTASLPPEELKDYQEKVHAMTTTIFDLTAHMKERNDCIAQNSKPSHSQSFNGSCSSIADSEELAQTNDKYIKQQTEYQQELREVKQELNVKETLHNKLIENYQKLRSLNDVESVKLKIRECEETISKLEKEQEDLKAALRNKNSAVSVKLAEERRKRVQQLEVQIAEYKKKTKVQAQLLKQHEKDADQINKLSSEILEMKQTKVKLIKKMKAESDDFRQWKAQREKELAQLRSKERKMESEAVKKDLINEKQRFVLQRKFEESIAANKRLKEVLLKVQKNKENKQMTKGTSAYSTNWLNEEIELITSIVDIKQSYERLNEARADLTSRLNKAKRQKPQNKELIKQIGEDIEMHNAQIKDLLGKINANDLDARIRAIRDGYQNLSESRSIVRHLLNNIVENRRNFNTCFAQARDCKQTLEEQSKQMEEKKVEVEEQLQQFKRKLEEAQNENAEKQSLLLKALASEGSQSAIVELLQQQLSDMTAELEQLKASKIMMNPRKRTRVEVVSDVIELDDSIYRIDDSFDDDHEMDPDWQKTPLFKAKRKTTRSISVENETIGAPKPAKKPAKRSKNSCGCKGKNGCKEGACGCAVNARKCSESCTCFTHKKCKNFMGNSALELENQSTDISNASNNKIQDKENTADSENVVPCTPPKRKCSADDIINPYIYSHKKRNPIFTTKDEI